MSYIEIADEIYALIAPYYGAFTINQPNFRRSIKGDELQELLNGLHDLIRKIYEENKVA